MAEKWMSLQDRFSSSAACQMKWCVNSSDFKFSILRKTLESLFWGCSSLFRFELMSMLIVTQPDQIAGIFTTGNARNIEWAEKKNQIFASFLKPSSIYIKIITHLALLNVQEFLQVKCHKKNKWMDEWIQELSQSNGIQWKSWWSVMWYKKWNDHGHEFVVIKRCCAGITLILLLEFFSQSLKPQHIHKLISVKTKAE